MGEVLAVRQVDSPIGELRLAATSRGLVGIGLPRSGGRGFTGWLRRQLPDAERIPDLPTLDLAARELLEYLSGQRREFSLSLDLRGTPFQIEVWRSLTRIPYAQTRSYADIAREIGCPAACRAVGAANGANPLPIVVPCHRVIRSGGSLGGYAGGLETKRRLLALEQALPSSERLL